MKGFKSLVFFALVFDFSCSFLLNDKTTRPGTNNGAFLTDSHYNTLMDMIYQERQSRLRLEQYVTKVHERMFAVEQENEIMKAKINLLENKTYACSDIILQNLQNETDLLAVNYQVVLKEQINISKRTLAVERDINAIKNVNSFSEFKQINNSTSDCSQLTHELHILKGDVNDLKLDSIARNQDFIALLRKSNANEQNVNQSFRRINMTQESLQQKVKTVSSKVALTACTSATEFPLMNKSDVIKFPRVFSHDGIQNLSAFTTAGVFTCRDSRLYIVHMTLITDTDSSYVQIFRNSRVIASLFTSSSTRYHPTSGSGMGSVELVAGDTIVVKAESNNILLNSACCLTIVKIK